MHLWEVATLEAIRKKIGRIKELDEETGSICVTVNGFNPLLFNLVVPFATGDEVVVTIEYDKLSGYCKHCWRLTHDVLVCPDLTNANAVRGNGDHTDKRGIHQRQQVSTKQGSVQHDGGWEKPRKHVKWALDFHSEHSNERRQPQFRGGESSASGFPLQVRNHGQAWGHQMRYQSSGSGTNMGYVSGSQMVGGDMVDPGTGLPPQRKGIRPVWPKPMYKVKQASGEKKAQSLNFGGASSGTLEDASMEMAVDHGVKGGNNDLTESPFNESTDDLLEDGEFDDVDNPEELGQESDTVTNAGTESGLGAEDDTTQGKGNKSGVVGKQGQQAKGGTGGSRTLKKGMVALLKPPAHT